jgi:hypothetical protein
LPKHNTFIAVKYCATFACFTVIDSDMIAVTMMLIPIHSSKQESSCMEKRNKRSMYLIGLTVALAVVWAPSILAQTAAASVAQLKSDGDDVPTDAELASTQCAIGEEKFLPADYYYCLGRQTYGERRYAYAQKFFTAAASWASKPAQYVLSIMALNGDHQPVNRPLALAWLTLASERPNSDYKLAYESLYNSASASERKAAEQLLVTMRLTYADNTAAVRAEKRYAAGMATLTKLSNNGGKYCMAGVTSMAQTNTDPTNCPDVQIVMKAIDTTAATVFDGWVGHVQVGPLQQVSGPDDKHSSN